MPANGWAVSELVPSGIKREADGQCNRKETAVLGLEIGLRIGAVRVKRCGKSAPAILERGSAR